MSKYLATMLVVPAALLLVGAVEPQADPVPVPVALAAAERAPLRVALDLARGRRWELGWDALVAYDLATGEIIRTVRLPGATFSAARGACLPDMLLGRSGAVLVSSNAQPRLWRVNPARFEVEIIDIVPADDQDKDFGFSRLAWGANESTLQAVNTPLGTAWKIDLGTLAAKRLDASAAGQCAS
jgi:hypothetical protein